MCFRATHSVTKALGRHPSFRLRKLRQPDVFPGALGPWGPGLLTWFHTQSWTERMARSINKQTSVDSWFCSHRMPCTLKPGIPYGKCAAWLSHAMRAAYGYFHEAVMFPGRQATCRAVFGTWGFFPDDAQASHYPFVLTSFTGWMLKD